MTDLLETEKDENEEMQKTIQLLRDDSKSLKSINDSLTHKLKIIEREQNKELDLLESKLDEVIKELNNKKSKNRALESTVDSLEAEKKDFQDLISKLSDEKSTLKSQLDEVESKMRDIISEKTIGLRSFTAKENNENVYPHSQRNLVEKLKVLDEIHSAIKVQKKSGSKFSMDYEF